MKKFIFISLIILSVVINTPFIFAQQNIVKHWYFLMSTDIFVVVGPFDNLKTCIELNTWAKQNGVRRNKISPCWESK